MARIGCSQRNLESTSLVYRRLFSCPGGLGRRGFRKATYGQSAQVYPVDPGLIPVFDLSGRANLSHALETVVRIELEPQGMDVRYVSTREGFEVGFMARSPEGGETVDCNLVNLFTASDPLYTLASPKLTLTRGLLSCLQRRDSVRVEGSSTFVIQESILRETDSSPLRN
jgi:hypothetical protein